MAPPAIAAAKSAPPQIATLILPADTAWNEADGIAEVPADSQRPSYSPQAVDEAAKVLKNNGSETLVLVTGAGLTAEGLALAEQIAGKTGCKVMGQTYHPRMARGRGRFSIDRCPLRDRAGAADPEKLQAYRAGRGERADRLLCLSEQAEHPEARGLRGASHDLMGR